MFVQMAKSLVVRTSTMKRRLDLNKGICNESRNIQHMPYLWFRKTRGKFYLGTRNSTFQVS